MKDTKMCPECATKIPANAKRCPNCRKNLRSWIGRHPILTVLLVFFIIFVVAMNKAKSQVQEARQKVSITNNDTDTRGLSGVYLNYNYHIIYTPSDSRYTATFTPFLPANDTTVKGAMFEVVNETYGKHLVTDLAPQIVSRDGTNLVKFSGQGNDYYFLLIKEDTGEVHSLVYWQE